MASRLVKSTHIFVQGELTTRQYDRIITVLTAKHSVDQVIQQIAVELKASAFHERAC
jgi:hypothetical protein